MEIFKYEYYDHIYLHRLQSRLDELSLEDETEKYIQNEGAEGVLTYPFNQNKPMVVITGVTGYIGS